MATEKPKKTPAGINRFRAALAQIASVPKKAVDERVQRVADKRRKK